MDEPLDLVGFTGGIVERGFARIGMFVRFAISQVGEPARKGEARILVRTKQRPADYFVVVRMSHASCGTDRLVPHRLQTQMSTFAGPDREDHVRGSSTPGTPGLGRTVQEGRASAKRRKRSRSPPVEL